jgi:hypothetical protein
MQLIEKHLRDGGRCRKFPLPITHYAFLMQELVESAKQDGYDDNSKNKHEHEAFDTGFSHFPLQGNPPDAYSGTSSHARERL